MSSPFVAPFRLPPTRDYLVSLTRTSEPKPLIPQVDAKRLRDARTGAWRLQDAEARFSELVRRVRSEGPQLVTVHGRDEVVVISADEYRRLKGERTGDALIEALQASPHRDIDITPPRAAMPVRDVVV